jgi:cold shock CspA family protein
MATRVVPQELPAIVKVFRLQNNKIENELIPDKKDGYLGSSSEVNGNFRVEIIPKGGLCFALKAKTNPNSEQQFDLKILNSRTVNGRLTYSKEIAVSPAENYNGLPVTRWPKNHIKFVNISQDKSDNFMFRLWEVGIVTQIPDGSASNFFLISQLVHESRICKNQFGTIILPGWPESRDWPIVLEQLELFFTPQMLPVFDGGKKEIAAAEKTKIKVRKNIGVVKWYNLAYQIGAIALDGFNARVHWSQINTKERLKALCEGQKVRIKDVRPAANTHQSPRLTKFVYDAIGVSPISYRR